MTTTQHGTTPAPGVVDSFAGTGITGKTFANVAAQFALKGHALQATTRADDGRVTFTVSRWSQSRAFTVWHDVLGFLAQIGGAE